MSAASSRGGGGGAAGGGSGNGGRGGGGQKKGFGLAGTVGETNKQQKQGGVAGLEALVLARAENSFNHQLPDEDAEGQRGQAPGGRQRRPRQGPQPPSSLTAQFMHVPSGPSFYQNLPPGGSAGRRVTDPVAAAQAVGRSGNAAQPQRRVAMIPERSGGTGYKPTIDLQNPFSDQEGGAGAAGAAGGKRQTTKDKLRQQQETAPSGEWLYTRTGGPKGKGGGGGAKGKGGSGGRGGRGGGGQLGALELGSRSGGASDPGAAARLRGMREAQAAGGKPIAGGPRRGRGSSGDDDSDVEEPESSGYGARRSGSAGGSSGASGGGGKRKAGTPHPRVKQKGGGGARGRKRPPATPEVIDLADSDEEDSDEEGGGSGSSDDGATAFRATGISSRRGKAGEFGPLKVHSLLAFVGTYPKGWLGPGGGSGGGGSARGGGRRAQPPRRAKREEDDDDDWGKDAVPAKGEEEGEEDEEEEVKEVAAGEEGLGEVQWEETPCFHVHASFDMSQKLLHVSWTAPDIGDGKYHGDRFFPFADLEAVTLFTNVPDLGDDHALLLLAGAAEPDKRGKRGAAAAADRGRERPRVVVAIFVGMNKKVLPQAGGVLGAGAKTNGEELGQLFGQRGHKVEALHRVLQRFDDPTAAPEALGLKLTLVLSHREAALRPFALQDEQPASKAERDLYAQHKEDYRAQLQQQQQQPVQSGLRRSSRAATRASSAAAGRGGGAEVSIVEDAKLLFKFPLEEDEADRVTVTSLDRERLAPGEFLNDNVIDFHFKYFLDQLKRSEHEGDRALYRQIQEGVYIFSTHFFSKLSEDVFIPPIEELVAAAAKEKAEAAAAAAAAAEAASKAPEGADGNEAEPSLAAAASASAAEASQEEGEAAAAAESEDDEDDLKILLKTQGAKAAPAGDGEEGEGEGEGEGGERDGSASAAALSSQASSPLPKMSGEEKRLLREEARAKAAHRLVARWTKSIDLFTKKMIFVPINEALHWSLAVLCNLDQVQYLEKPPPKTPKAPKLSPAPSRRSSRRSLGVGSSPGSVLVVQEEEAGSEEADEEAASASAAASSAAGGDDDADEEEEEEEGQREQQETEPGASDAKVKAEAMSVDGEDGGRVMGGRPCVVFLDSLHAHRPEKIHNFLVKYLQQEWKKRKPGQPMPCITKETVPIIKPVVPTQDNSCDCGVFVIEYGELMLRRVLPTLPNWTEADLSRQEKLGRHIPSDSFTLGDVAKRRRTLLSVFKHLEHEYERRQDAAEEDAKAEAARAAALAASPAGAAAASAQEGEEDQEQEQGSSEDGASSPAPSASSSSSVAAPGEGATTAAAAASASASSGSPSAPSEEAEAAPAGEAGGEPEEEEEPEGGGTPGKGKKKKQRKRRRAEGRGEKEEPGEEEDEAPPAQPPPSPVASPSPALGSKRKRRAREGGGEEETAAAGAEGEDGGIFGDVSLGEQRKKRKAAAAAVDVDAEEEEEGGSASVGAEAASQEVGDVAPPREMETVDVEDYMGEDDAASTDVQEHQRAIMGTVGTKGGKGKGKAEDEDEEESRPLLPLAEQRGEEDAELLAEAEDVLGDGEDGGRAAGAGKGRKRGTERGRGEVTAQTDGGVVMVLD